MDLVTAPSFRQRLAVRSELVGAQDFTTGPGRKGLVDRQVAGVGVGAVLLAAQGESCTSRL